MYRTYLDKCFDNLFVLQPQLFSLKGYFVIFGTNFSFDYKSSTHTKFWKKSFLVLNDLVLGMNA